MFERFTDDARAIVTRATAHADALQHGWIGTEHLLLGLLDDAAGRPARLLAPWDVQRDWVLAEVERLIGRGEPDLDAGALATLGIDLDEVRSAVRQTFGDDAVERLRRPVHQPWQPWRRPSRRCMSLLAGGMGVAPRVKQAFEHARRDADRRQRPAIDPTGLLLGMVEVEDALSNRLLRDAGIDPSEVRRVLRDATG